MRVCEARSDLSCSKAYITPNSGISFDWFAKMFEPPKVLFSGNLECITVVEL